MRILAVLITGLLLAGCSHFDYGGAPAGGPSVKTQKSAKVTASKKLPVPVPVAKPAIEPIAEPAPVAVKPEMNADPIASTPATAPAKDAAKAKRHWWQICKKKQ